MKVFNIIKDTNMPRLPAAADLQARRSPAKQKYLGG